MATDEMVLVFLRAWYEAAEDEGACLYPDDEAIKAGLEAVFAQARREIAHEALKPPASYRERDVVKRAAPFMATCGPCDFGLAEFGCACPEGDFRPIVADLVAEVERLRSLLPPAA